MVVVELKRYCALKFVTEVYDKLVMGSSDKAGPQWICAVDTWVLVFVMTIVLRLFAYSSKLIIFFLLRIINLY